MEVTTGDLLYPAMSDIFCDSRGYLKVSFRISKAKLIVEVEAPSIQLALLCNASTMAASSRDLNNFLALERLAIEEHWLVPKFNLIILWKGTNAKPSMTCLPKAVQLILLIQD